MKTLKLEDLYNHPDNPRLAPRQDVIDQIAAQLNGAMDEVHALLVRPDGKGYQIISGHHRAAAARQAGLKEVPCWVREMSDEDAYMALALNNAQGELHPLEVGMHALRSGLSGSEYARRAGMNQPEVSRRLMAARVSEVMPHGIKPDFWRHLAEIHVAPEWAWEDLAAALVEEEWSVEVTRKRVAQFKAYGKKGEEVPGWIDLRKVAKVMVAGGKDPVPEMMTEAARAKRTLEERKLEAPRLIEKLDQLLQGSYRVSDVKVATAQVLNEQEKLLKVQREKEEQEAREKEEAEQRMLRFHKHVSLEEWKELKAEEREALLNVRSADGAAFNKQTNEDIEWADWSWNPITGCLHACPYCYAREIATSTTMQKVFPHGFAPMLRPNALVSPLLHRVPAEAAKDVRKKNVFTCSMADLFGKWVPKEWIETVLARVREAHQWNFLFLTKFPQRMAEFDYPENVWLGTTVDMQYRVQKAEKAFEKLAERKVYRWLSVEPMLEPLTFTRLDLFDWIVIGGASAQTRQGTPDWRPLFEWIYRLKCQAEDAGVKVYFKTNLLGQTSRDGNMQAPAGMPIPEDRLELPDALKYMGKE